MAKLKIPSPWTDNLEQSLVLQGEIVRTLSTYAELRLHQEQYEYHPDQPSSLSKPGEGNQMRYSLQEIPQQEEFNGIQYTRKKI